MEKNRKVSRLATAYILLAGSCWGVIGIFTKKLTANGCSAVQITFIRCALAAVMIWLFLLVFDRAKLKIRFRDIWMFLGTGVLSVAFFSVMYFKTQQAATLSVAAVLLYTAPCFVMLLSSVFFRERITGKKILALVLSFFGCVFTTGLMASIISGGAAAVPGTAIFTGIASGLGYALYTIFGNAALKRYSSITVTAYTMLTASLALLPLSAGPSLARAFSESGTVMSAIGIAVVSTVLPYLLYTQGLKHTEPGRASVMAFIEPVVATLTGVFFFREKLTAGGIVGIALIFISIVILNTRSQKKLQRG